MKVLVCVFTCVICAAIMAGFDIYFLRKMYLADASASWQRVEGTVVAVVEGKNESDVRYEYEAKGRKYRGSNLEYLSSFTGKAGGARSREFISANFAKGQKIDVYVDPADPERSVLVRNYPNFNNSSMLLWVNLLGVTTMVGAFRQYRRERATEVQA